VSAVHVVLPGDVDDVSVPSGGNIYDRRLCEGLESVHEIVVSGGWPRPDTSARTALASALAEIPDGEVVLLDGLVACGVPEIVVPQAKRLGVAVLVHLPLGDETGLAPALAAELDGREREMLLAAGAVVATSPWAARRLVEHHGLARERVHVVTPGVDAEPLAPGTDGVSSLLCVASLTPRKGHDLLVEALAAVAELPWTCVFAGPVSRDPGHVEEIRRLIERHGLGQRVLVVGPLTGEPLANAYSAADLAVLPSRAETYGMVVTEALARGIPVLATAVDGVPETLGQAPDGTVPGILVPSGDVDALATALRRWFGESGVRDRLRASARLRRDALEPWSETSRRMADVLARLGREAA
jgi:glycosyltransferase involved in cell wall biosynthesis